MRRFLFAVLFSILSGTIAAVAQPRKATVRPNILFILSDDHSVPFLGCYGNPDLKTPNIDALAARGMRFNRMYVTSPQCAPSRSSMMTGRSAVDIRQTRFASPLRADIPVYPELLRKAGYYTGVCGRIYHTDGGGNNNPEATQKVFDEFGLVTMPGRVDFLRGEAKDTEVLDQVKAFLDQLPKNKPWFLQTGYHDPHRPYTAVDFQPDPEKLTLPAGMPDTKALRKDLAAHYGEIQQLDTYIGVLMAELERRKALENTVVIFMGDNGAALWRGKGSLWDRGLHVPFLVSWPGMISPGSVSDALLSGEDLAPTVLDMAGLKAPKEMTGKSALPVLKGSPAEIRNYVFAERGAHGQGLPRNTGTFDLSRTVFNKRYKLIYNVLYQLPYSPVDYASQPFWMELVDLQKQGKLDKKHDIVFNTPRPLFELYDLERDPEEVTNLAGKADYSSAEKELKEQLQRWMILNWDYLPLPVVRAANGAQ